jgi:3-phenylpropionate/trans-cinnamate dioxygenase ferredoxin reductase subunit
MRSEGRRRSDTDVENRDRESVVVVGNGVAGYACAARLSELEIPVTMIGPGLPHDRPPLSKRALTTGRVPLLADAARLAESGIEHLDGLVTDVDPATRRLVVRLATGGEPLELAPARLVWATGLRYPRPPIPGFEVAHENTSAVGLEALFSALTEPERSVVILGAGLIGTETAATLALDGHRVVLLDMVDRPLARFLPRVSDAARSELARLGVRFCGECAVDGVERDTGLVVQTSTHGALPCDVVVSAAGVRTSLPEALVSGDPRAVALDADETLRVLGHEDVWACGDCVSFPHPRFGRIAIPHWDHARSSGRHVAQAIAGATESYARDPYFFSDIGKLRVQQVGLADQAVEWRSDDGLAVGRDEAGMPTCAVLLNAPARLREARELLAGTPLPYPTPISREEVRT